MRIRVAVVLLVCPKGAGGTTAGRVPQRWVSDNGICALSLSLCMCVRMCECVVCKVQRRMSSRLLSLISSPLSDSTSNKPTCCAQSVDEYCSRKSASSCFYMRAMCWQVAHIPCDPMPGCCWRSSLCNWLGGVRPILRVDEKGRSRARLQERTDGRFKIGR